MAEFKGKPTINNLAIEKASEEIFDILRICDGPKDAALVFASAYIKFLHATFPPELKKAASEAVDVMAKTVKAELDLGWN